MFCLVVNQLIVWTLLHKKLLTASPALSLWSVQKLLLHDQRQTCILIALHYYAVILPIATFWPVCLLEGGCETDFFSCRAPFSSLSSLSSLFLDSHWWTEGKKRGKGRGGERRGGWGWREGGVTIELSTHTRPPLVTCVGLGQKKRRGCARTHTQVHTHNRTHTKNTKTTAF